MVYFFFLFTAYNLANNWLGPIFNKSHISIVPSPPAYDFTTS